MATLDQTIKDKPKLRKYFSDELPRVTGKESVWKAFLKRSGHQLEG